MTRAKPVFIDQEEIIKVLKVRGQVTIDDLTVDFNVPKKSLIAKLRILQSQGKVHAAAPAAHDEFHRTVWATGPKDSETAYDMRVQVTTKHWKSDPFQVTMLEQLLFAKPEPRGTQSCLF